MTELIDDTSLADLHGRAAALREALNAIILGQDELIRLVLVGILAEGHVLLEGLPGLGKTELVKAIGHLTGLAQQRIQFTPDLLPADITGTQILDDSGSTRLSFRKGPLFAQLVLADEINRASPKTQSALLQAMAERTVSAFDQTYELPNPFFVLATQNPIEQDGTYPLPEAQLDRFAIKLLVTGVGDDVLQRILCERPDGRPPWPAPICDGAGMRHLLDGCRRIALPTAVADYIARLVNATRPELGAVAAVTPHLRWGASPRAAIALAGCARAAALLDGRPAVGFDDVRGLAPAVLRHRLICSYEAGLSGIDADAVIQMILAAIPEVA